MGMLFFFGPKASEQRHAYMTCLSYSIYTRGSRIQVTFENYHLPIVEDRDITTVEVYHLVTVT
jgi:hypothetical protein